MARIRSIKPQFWDDTKVGKLSRDARLLYIGLWNFCDDLGVVINNTIWLRSKIFPYDQIQLPQMEKWLEELVRLGFICLFSYKEEEFICLPNFTRHQKINKPNYVDVCVPKLLLDKIKQQLLCESLNNHGTITELSVPIEEEGEDIEYISTSSDEEDREETSSSPTGSADQGEKVDFKRVLSLYHSICTDFPKLEKLTDTRKAKIKLRFREMGCEYEKIETLFRKMQASKFMQGDNSRGWKADFDWLFANDKNWPKVLEGKYDNSISRVGEKKSEVQKNLEFVQRMGVNSSNVAF